MSHWSLSGCFGKISSWKYVMVISQVICQGVEKRISFYIIKCHLYDLRSKKGIEILMSYSLIFYMGNNIYYSTYRHKFCLTKYIIGHHWAPNNCIGRCRIKKQRHNITYSSKNLHGTFICLLDYCLLPGEGLTFI